VVPLSVFRKDQIGMTLGRQDHLTSCLATVGGLLTKSNQLIGVTSLDNAGKQLQRLFEAETRAHTCGYTARD
jgi:hypothetical protein